MLDLDIQCSVCRAMLPPTHFEPRRHQCRECLRKRDAAQYLANRAKICAKAKARYLANPQPAKLRSAQRYAEKKPELIAQMRDWARRNPAKVAVKNTRWKKANPEKIRLADRARYQRDPAKEIAKVQRRHALARTPHAHLISIHDIIARDGPRCYICGVKTEPKARYASPVKSHLEHVVPLAAGGTHTAENLKCACRRCNMLKGAKHSPQSVATLLLGIPIVA